MTRDSGPSSPARSRIERGTPRMYSIMGITKAAVLPLPVSAMPITSRRFWPTGMACRWIGVGLSYPSSSIAFITCGITDDSLHDRSGLAARPPCARETGCTREPRVRAAAENKDKGGCVSVP